LLTEAEIEVLDLLGECATKFGALSPEHTSDLNEFCLAIHAAQNIVMARQGMREYRILKRLPHNWKKEPV
jgi:hypothetical protein